VNPFELLDLAIAPAISQLALNGLDELTPTDRHAFGPKSLALPGARYVRPRHFAWADLPRRTFDPFGVRGGQTRNIDLQRRGQRRAVDDATARPLPLDLVIPADLPLCRMLDGTGADHVEVDVDHAARQVLAGLDRGGLVAVLPEGAVARFALIERAAPSDPRSACQT